MADFKSNRITLFREQYDAISKLPASIQGKVYKALMDYNFTGALPKLDGVAQLAFDLIKAGLDVSLAKQRAGQAGGYQRASNSQAEVKQQPSRTLVEVKQTASKDVADAKQEASKSLAVKRSIEKSSIEREDNKESKYVSIQESVGARVQSYEEVMNDLEVEESIKPMLWEFIKHCQANGHTLINSKLRSIILALDEAYGNSVRPKIFSLKRAIDRGYYDIAENNQQTSI